MQMLDVLTRLLLIPGIFVMISLFILEAIKDVKEWSRDMVDEKLRQKMGRLLEDGQYNEALEISHVIDIQVLETMRDRGKIPSKTKIPTVETSEYRVIKENY